MNSIKALYAFIIAEITKAHEVFVAQTLWQNVMTIVLLYMFTAILPLIAVVALAVRIKNKFTA